VVRLLFISRVFILLVLAASGIFFPRAYAERSDTSFLNLQQTEAPSFAVPAPINSLTLQNSQYLSSGAPAYRAGAETQTTSAVIRLEDSTALSRDFLAKLKAKDEYSAGENWNYVDVHELYVQAGRDHSRLTVGRRLDNWSEWDAEWKQGEFEPRYLENRLRSEAAGLTGAFYSVSDDRWSGTVGALAFIPDFGPHFTTENNRFNAKNPWFHSPNSAFIYRKGEGEIHYSVKTPATVDVVKQPGAVAKLEFRENKYFGRLSFAYKPMPQMMMGFPSEHQVVITSDADYMNVTVIPRIVYNRIVNLDNQYAQGPWLFSTSVAYDNPEVNAGPADWTAQQVQPATILSATVSRRLEEEGPHAARLQFGVLKVNGGDAPDRGRFAGAESLFEHRFQYYEAYMVALKKDFRSWFRRPLETEVRAIYDRMQSGGVLSFDAGMSLSANLRAELELDFIGLLSSSGPIADGFLSSYRANDRVGLGVSYVF
jgi:hypothetical protein